MLEYLKKEANMTRTENGAATHRSTLSDCVDLFASVGALRRESDEEICSRFLRAYSEDAVTAMRIAFYARDVRGGLGERRVFRTILRWLAENEPASAVKNIRHIAEFGRWDDLLCLLGTPCEKAAIDTVVAQLKADSEAMDCGENISLLAKWLPSVNASNPETVRQAKRIARALGMNDAAYRKMLSAMRAEIRIIENNLRTGDYSFDYAKQPSRAMFKYRKAFSRNDGERYSDYLSSVEKGGVKLNASALYPYDVVMPFFKQNVEESECRSIDLTWRSLPDFTNGENALVVVDGSGSMYGGGEPLPAAVALSLGIYFAERNTGAFRNHFITFSEKPQLVEIKGKNILEKLRYCHDFNEVANTNLQRVFELILNTAVRNSLPQSEMPARLYIVSDMEFDYCIDNADITNFEYEKRLFSRHGYRLPEIVFWNVAARTRQMPVTMNEQGVALVSGCTPRLFSMVASGDMSPYTVMMDVLGSGRYDCIAA
ncbi:MAG: DUF2828 family protein [Oscillospiraceae bacterium]|nr:DUF2828 family protein [Oscillospiraceae bacterium]